MRWLTLSSLRTTGAWTTKNRTKQTHNKKTQINKKKDKSKAKRQNKIKPEDNNHHKTNLREKQTEQIIIVKLNKQEKTKKQKKQTLTSWSPFLPAILFSTSLSLSSCCSLSISWPFSSISSWRAAIWDWKTWREKKYIFTKLCLDHTSWVTDMILLESESDQHWKGWKRAKICEDLRKLANVIVFSCNFVKTRKATFFRSYLGIWIQVRCQVSSYSLSNSKVFQDYWGSSHDVTKIQLENNWSSWDFTFMMFKSSWNYYSYKFSLRMLLRDAASRWRPR